MSVPGTRSIPRISLGSWAFSFGPFAAAPWSFDRVCRFAVEAGYDGIEINGFRPHPHPKDYADAASVARLRRELSDLGLGVSGFAPSFMDTPPAVVERAEYLAVLDDALVFCDRLDVRTLRLDTVSPPEQLTGPVYQARWQRLVDTWRAAAERSDRFGIDLVWEFEPGFWLNRPSEIRGMVDAIDHPRFKLLFDTSHAHLCAAVGARQTGTPEVLPGGAVDLAAMLADQVGHLHVIDSDGSLHDEETSAHLPFGEGVVDFRETLRALGRPQERFEWWCCDFCFCPTTERDAARAIPYLRQLGEELK